MATIDLTTYDDNADKSNEIQVNFSDEEKALIKQYKDKINLNSTTDIIQFGVSSQTKVSNFSNEILKQVRTKDMGGAEDILLNLRSDIKSFDENLKKKPLIPFFDNMKKKIQRMRTEYASVEKNIHQIELKLEGHYKTLLKDVNIFDKLFVENQNYFKELSLHIAAGEEKLQDVYTNVLPQLKKEAEETGDQHKIQAYKDTEQHVVRFERKIHDLKLTRMVVLQTAPQIRMIQSNSSSLMEKVQSSIVNTLPLWKNQMVLTLGIAHSQRALEAQKAVTDATNELLRKNSEMLKESTVNIARETERGIVDIETIKKANSDIIQTIEQVLQIQREGREKRKVVEQELLQAETELKQNILKSSDDTKLIN
ncbi:toxic anion resistance protein [Sphingobacterium alkalisoli]|uniref:Toxic anion resistance protein n=1 Tax=Sphingobacterium alkalisoli TaxID=1874115 RepID=A0A4U0GYY2_9SPHI|nr:toxic anion resistance protein [Sphingobacterium alkalisoli]TJY64441.1 toxic anion resistance protein [Sphingobacterium alkalisoli]GGH21752.1 tellurium resistance protein [Sphingobacterium alkalisoli]